MLARAFLLTLLLLAGCASREGALRSENYEKVHISGATEKQIVIAAQHAFAAHGFYPTTDSIPQELVFQKTAPLLFRLAKGGNALVWFVLEPRADGWDIYCVPEPDNLYPGGTAMRFRGLLDQIARESHRD